MTATRWRDSLPPPQPTRHRVRARQDFEDSLLADQLQGPTHPALAMLAAAQAPRQRIVLPQASRPARPTMPTQEKRRGDTWPDDRGDPAPTGSPSFAHYAGMVAGGAALVVCTWLASVHLPDMLERLVT